MSVEMGHNVHLNKELLTTKIFPEQKSNDNGQLEPTNHYSKILCFGQSNCDQFECIENEEEIYEVKKPFEIPNSLELYLKVV